ncbi:MAG: hypothetical protein ACOYLB_15190 [Phototrophicaceae bacterium]
MSIILIGCAPDGFDDLPPVLPTSTSLPTLPPPTLTPLVTPTALGALANVQVQIQWVETEDSISLNEGIPIFGADDRSEYAFGVQVIGIDARELEGLPVYLQLNGSGRIAQTPVFLDAQGMAQTIYTVGESTDTSTIKIIPNLELRDGTIIRNEEGLNFQIMYEDIAIVLSQCSSLVAIGYESQIEFTVRSSSSVTQAGKYEVRALPSRADAVGMESDRVEVVANQPYRLTWYSKLRDEAGTAEICLSLSERPTLAPQCLLVGWGAPVDNATLSVGISRLATSGQSPEIDSYWAGSSEEIKLNRPSIRALLESEMVELNRTVLSVQHDVISTWDQDLLSPLFSRDDLYASAPHHVNQAECDVFVAPVGASNIYYNINVANPERRTSDKSWLGEWIIRYPSISGEQVHRSTRLITAEPIRLVRNQPMTFNLTVDNASITMTEYDPNWYVHSATPFSAQRSLPVYLRFYVHQDALDVSDPQSPFLSPQPSNAIVTRLEWFNQEQKTNLTLNAIAGIPVDYVEPVVEYPGWYLVYVRATLPKDSASLFNRVAYN